MYISQAWRAACKLSAIRQALFILAANVHSQAWRAACKLSAIRQVLFILVANVYQDSDSKVRTSLAMVRSHEWCSTWRSGVISVLVTKPTTFTISVGIGI